MVSNLPSEKLLYYIWQYQKFAQRDLTITEGQSIQIVKVGHHNTDAGPDFQEAKIYIDEVLWAGNVEIHVLASHWYMHRHTDDLAYQNIILHVVWQKDKDVFRADGQVIPTLELASLVDVAFLDKYYVLMHSQASIPCQGSFKTIANIHKQLHLERMQIERLEQKADLILQQWNNCNHDWEEVHYQVLAKSFGFKTNAAGFEYLTKIVPYQLVKKQSNLLSVQALLLGVAGFLTDEPQFAMLKKEYLFLKSKYQITQEVPSNVWKFLRLRPANFPNKRLLELAIILFQNKTFHSKCINFNEVPELMSLFEITKESKELTQNILPNPKLSIGKMIKEGLLVNFVAPMLAAWGIQNHNYEYLEKALGVWSAMGAENNFITRQWQQLGLSFENAGQSQGSLQWYNAYCSQKRCLECSLIHVLLQN